MLAAMVPVMLSGTMSAVGHRRVASRAPLARRCGPFFPGVPAFLLFFLAMLAESNRIPFDIPEAESELVAGVTTEYTGAKFTLFYMGEYVHTLVGSAVAAALFLGGWDGPFAPGLHWMVLKTLVLFALVYWVRWSLLRFRADQLMDLLEAPRALRRGSWSSRRRLGELVTGGPIDGLLPRHARRALGTTLRTAFRAAADRGVPRGASGRARSATARASPWSTTSTASWPASGACVRAHLPLAGHHDEGHREEGVAGHREEAAVRRRISTWISARASAASSASRCATATRSVMTREPERRPSPGDDLVLDIDAALRANAKEKHRLGPGPRGTAEPPRRCKTPGREGRPLRHRTERSDGAIFATAPRARSSRRSSSYGAGTSSTPCSGSGVALWLATAALYARWARPSSPACRCFSTWAASSR